MTELEDVTRKLRDHIDGLPTAHDPRLMHELLDDVIHEALITRPGDDAPPTRWQLCFMDAAGDWQVMEEPPGHVEVTVEQWRGIAAILIEAGAVEVRLQRSSPWHNVETWEAEGV